MHVVSDTATRSTRPTANGVALHLDRVSKVFRPHGRSPVHALDRVDVGVDAGEFVSLIGPSGCGKSTLLRVIGGLTRYDAGTVSIGDRSPEEAADLDWEGLLREGDAILVEWPERAGEWLPAPTRRFRLHHLPDPERRGLETL